MKTTILVISIVFLAMLGSVSPLPVSNTNYTKEYIANELQKTDLEPAKLMEYLAQLMQKPGTGEDKSENVKCKDSTDSVLDSSIIERIFSTSTNPFGNHLTYVITNGISTISESKPVNAYHLLVSKSSAAVPSNIWTNFSPCKHCAHILMGAFGKDEVKPTIHFAQLYSEEGKETVSLVESIQCLARLERAGFSVRVWNWSSFRDDYIEADKCKEQINKSIQTMEVIDSNNHLEEIDDFVHEIVQSSESVAGNWCNL